MKTTELTQGARMTPKETMLARRFASAGSVVAMALIVLLSLVPPATAAGAAPRWEVRVIAKPYHATPGPNNLYEVVLTNLGEAPANPTSTVELGLPPGVTFEAVHSDSDHWSCVEATVLTCTTSALPGYEYVDKFFIEVSIAPTAPDDLVVHARVSGGGGPEVQGSFTNYLTPVAARYEILGFASFGTDSGGASDLAAAGHPNGLNLALTTPVVRAADGTANGVESAKDLIFDFPTGFYASPTAAPTCPITTFFAIRAPECPAGSQIGAFSVSGGAGVAKGGAGGQGFVETRNPVFNLTPERGYPAELGFYDEELNAAVVAQGQLAHSSSGYLVRVVVPTANLGLFGPWYLQTSVFGNPQKRAGLPGPGKAFLTNPSECNGNPRSTGAHIDTYAKPAPLALNADGSTDFESADFSDSRWHNATAEAPPVAGCEALQFNPTIRFKATEFAADSPTGLNIDVAVAQNEDPEGLATPPLRDATVSLPKGLVVDPSSADGLSGCTEVQLAPDSTDPGNCPESSKIGTATLRTPLIEHQLEGSVYLGTPECAPCSNADASSGKLLKLYIEINDPKTGVVVKLPGTVAADPGSGQLTATFTENPQLPFEELELHVKSGARAPLTTPSTCGEYTTTSDLMPWSAPQSGPDAKPQSRFQITSGPNGSGCPNGEGGLSNSPKFEAGTTVPLAGTYSPFVLKVSRENGSQRIGSLEATLPAGLLGRLAGIPYCSDAAIAAAGSKGGRAEQASPSCPLASEVGTVNVGAGSGNPFYVQGHVYVAGPYKGAPLSLEIITPAVAGPFDLGTVAVRTALYVNESTAQIHAVSDPIPSILAGIPLDVRSIALNMDRPEFTLNPTSCNAMAVLGQATSTLGQSAALQSRFQVGGCRGLQFKPELKLAFSGQTKRTGFPAVKAVLTQPKGQNANLAGASVILPKGMLIANAHISNPCTRVQFNSGKLPGEGCPAKSILGSAKVWTPLLEKPEEGKVYFRSNGGERELPDLAVALRGQIPLQLLGFIDSVGKKGAEVRRVRSRFQGLPDAPVSRFELKLSGGKKGLLQNSKNLCKVSDKAKFALTGQNGATLDTEPKVQVKCGKGGGKRSGKKSGGGKKK
jgi:hypothetical protein